MPGSSFCSLIRAFFLKSSNDWHCACQWPPWLCSYRKISHLTCVFHLGKIWGLCQFSQGSHCVYLLSPGQSNHARFNSCFNTFWCHLIHVSLVLSGLCLGHGYELECANISLRDSTREDNSPQRWDVHGGQTFLQSPPLWTTFWIQELNACSINSLCHVVIVSIIGLEEYLLSATW